MHRFWLMTLMAFCMFGGVYYFRRLQPLAPNEVTLLANEVISDATVSASKGETPTGSLSASTEPSQKSER